MVFNGLVIIGNSGSDMGGIGHIRAFDATTGKQAWNFDNVPSSGPAAKTWPDDRDKIRAGGGVYSSFALDSQTGLLYAPVGNPGPDFVASYRPGDNLYTCGVVALDARTGELKGYHQFVKNDFHDWDVAASPILFSSKGGRQMVGAACKNGYAYGLSRDLKEQFFKTPVTRIENTDAPLTKEGTRFLPGTQGGPNWYGPSYSPPLNLLFVPTIDWATTIKLGDPSTLKKEPGKPFIGSANAFGDRQSSHRSIANIGWDHHAEGIAKKPNLRLRPLLPPADAFAKSSRPKTRSSGSARLRNGASANLMLLLFRTNWVRSVQSYREDGFVRFGFGRNATHTNRWTAAI